MAAIDEPTPTKAAVAQAEIHAMRQVADTLRVLSDVVTNQGKAQADHSAASTRAMEKLAEKVDDMNGRLIRLEEAKHGREIARIETAVTDVIKRVDSLEGVRVKATGAMGATGWVAKYAPWLLAIAVSALAGLGFDQAVK